MKHRSQWLLTSTLALGLLALPALAAATTYYVDDGGSDGNNGLTPGTAWQTISHAAATVPAGTSGAPNVIMVASGTYDLANGETFPINFDNDYVSLTGDGVGTPTLDTTQADTSLRDALDVDATGFSASGLTFTNASNGITIYEGGFSIAGNTFESTLSLGIYLDSTYSDIPVDVTVAAMSVTNNTFKTTGTGFYADVDLDFDDTVENLDLTIGAMTISGNTFTSGAGVSIYGPYVSDIYNGSVSIGNFSVTNNTFTGGGNAFRFDGTLDYMEDTEINVGAVTISNNTFTDQSNTTLRFFNYKVQYLSGTTTATFGDLTIDNNTITADATTYPNTDGIDLEHIWDFYYIYDETVVNVGSVNVTNNTVNVADQALYIYSYGIWDIGEEFWGDTVQITTGPLNVTGNTLTSDEDIGAYLYLAYIAYDTYGDVSVTSGAVTVSDNIISSYSEALYLYFYEWAYDMYETSVFSAGAVTVSDNTLTSSNNDGLHYEMDEYGYYMLGNSQANVGAVLIDNNTITSYGEALYFYLDDVGTYPEDNSSFTMDTVTISNNTMTSSDSYGIYYENYDVGYYMYDNSQVNVGAVLIDNNTIDSYEDALYFYYSSTAYELDGNSSFTMDPLTISNNTLTSSDYAALYWEMGEFADYMYGSAQATLGAVSITGNKLTGNQYALYFEFDDTAYYMYDTSEAILGTFTVMGNTMKSTGGSYDCLYIYYYDDYIGGYMYNYSQATLPSWIISNNSFDTVGDNYGFYFENEYNPYYLYDYSTANYGSMLIDNNTFNPDKNAGMVNGIYLYFYEPGYGSEGASTASYGDITISNNKLYNIVDEAIFVDYDEVPYYLTDHAPKFTMGNLAISKNTIDTAGYGIYTYLYLETEVGATVTIGDLDIAENILTNISDYGIYVDYDWVGNSNPDDAVITVGKTTIDSNEVSGLTGSSEGIYFYTDIEDVDNINFGEVNVLGNTVSGFNSGFYFGGLEGATVSISCNTAENNSISGLSFDGDGTVTVMNNSLFDNGLGLQVDGGSPATLVVNAEKNWWGDAAGPVACTTCNKIDAGPATVNFDPWLTSAPTSQCGGAFSWPMFIPAITGAGLR
jgi:Protein of unknown function (DUF1565)